MITKRFKTIVLVFVVSVSAFCQKPPATYGKIDIEDLKMKVYSPDSTAPAVVLCDFGYFSSTRLQFSRLLRIKILKKEGYELANEKYLTMSDPIIRGTTYNLEGETVVKEKLAGSAIYTKVISSGIYETSFAMPDVREGSVIDIEFTYPGLPYTWDFQWMVPVRHSELILEVSPFLEFTKNFFGYQPITISEPTRWVAMNVPAFKAEPYMDSYENYLTKFEIGLQMIGTTFLNSSWENVSRMLLEASDFPSTSRGALCLSALVDELKNSGLQGEELIKAAFEGIKKMKFNGENSLLISDEGLCGRYKLQSGNSADINFALMQVLNRLDIKAYPVVLSTRDNGILSSFHPSIEKLNYVIVAILTDGKYRLLDATEEFMPLTLLPDRCINGDGRFVSTTNPEKIAVTCNLKEKSIKTYDLGFDDNMNLTGTITCDYSDYAAFDFRKAFSKYNDKEEYARALEKTMPGLTISEITINNLSDLYSPAQVILKVTVEGMSQSIDNEIYVNPMLFEALKENPFKNNQRTYPVSYSRKAEEQVLLRLSLKEGMKAEVIPLTSTGKMRNNGLNYKYTVTNTGNTIDVKYEFARNSLTILQDNYREMREVYNQIVKKHSEPVIIKVQ